MGMGMRTEGMTTTTPTRRPSEFFPSREAAMRSLQAHGYRFHYFDNDSGEDVYVRVRCGDIGFAADVASLDGYADDWRICYY